MKRRLKLVVSKHREDDDHPPTSDIPIPHQVVLMDTHTDANEESFDHDLEKQTLDFLEEKLLRGSVFFHDNPHPENHLPRFSQDDLELGDKLGGGEFGKVYTIESFEKQHLSREPKAIVLGAAADTTNSDSRPSDENAHRHSSQQQQGPLSSSLGSPHIGYDIDGKDDLIESDDESDNPSSSLAVPFPTNQTDLYSCSSSSAARHISSSSMIRKLPECGYYYTTGEISDLEDDDDEEMERLGRVDRHRQYMIRHTHRDSQARYAVKVVRRELKGWKRYMATIDMACELKILAALCHPNVMQVRGIMGHVGRPGHFGIIMDRLSCTLEDKLDQWTHEAAAAAASGRNGHNRRLKTNPFTARKQGQQNQQPHLPLLQCLMGSGNKTSNTKFLDDEASLDPRDELLAERILACYDIARAMRYLHSQKILFRDLKPDNVGVTLRGNYVIFDMGLAQELRVTDLVEPPDGYVITGLTGSRMFMAPENATCKPYGFSSDVYSFAMLFWEVISLERAFEHWSLDKHYEQVILNGTRPHALGHLLPASLDRMMQDAWSVDPSCRPTFASICETMFAEIIQHTRKSEGDQTMDDRTAYLRELSLDSESQSSQRKLKCHPPTCAPPPAEKSNQTKKRQYKHRTNM